MNVYNYGSGGVGDITGIGLGAGAAPGSHTKASIGFIRTGTYGRGDLTFYINDQGNANPVVEGNERFRIASNGQVSISSDGTTDGLLTIKGDSDQVGTPSIRLLDGSDTREVSITNTSGDFIASVHGNDNAIHGHIKMFESGILDISNGGASGTNVNRLRIEADGKIGIGNVTSPINNVEIRTDAHGEGVTIKSTGNTSNALTFDANRGTGGVIGVAYGRWNGTTVAQMSFISGQDGTDKNDGYITFNTESAASNGNVNATERLRITSSGKISNTYDGTPSAPQYGQFELLKSGASNADPDWSYLSFHRVGAIAWQQGIDTNDFVIASTGGSAKDTLDAEKLRITTTGNIGQAVTPSAWSSAQANDFFAYQVGSGMAIFGRGSGDQDRGGISANLYSTASAWKYIADGHAGRIYFEDGSIVFSNGGSSAGSAGDTVSLSELLRITAAGQTRVLGGNSNDPLYVRGGTESNASIRLEGGVSANDNSRIEAKYNLALACNGDGNQSSRAIRFYNNTTMLANMTDEGRMGIGITAPEAVLHPRANTSHGTDTAFQVGTGTRFFKLNELSNQDNFGQCYMSFYDNSLREILTLENSYAGATGMGMEIAFRGLSSGKTGHIQAYNTIVNSGQSELALGASGGTALRINHDKIITFDGKLRGNYGVDNSNGNSNKVASGHCQKWVSSNMSGGLANGWYPIIHLTDGCYLVLLKTGAHSSCLFSASNGYDGSQKSAINVLHYTDNPNGSYLNVDGIRITNDGVIEVHLNASTTSYFYMEAQILGAENIDNSLMFYNTLTASSSSSINDTKYPLTYGFGAMQIENMKVDGTLSKTNGSFRIPHPLPALKDTKDLLHSFIEGPQCDNIYRGKIDLVDGTATVNLDTKSNMTEGTFVALNRDVQCYTTNETGWTNIKGSVSGNTLTITAQDNSCTDTISWMVIGERQDDNIKSERCLITDNDGNLLVELDRFSNSGQAPDDSKPNEI